MVLPGLGQDGGEGEDDHTFAPADFMSSSPRCAFSSRLEADEVDGLGQYTIAESSFLDCLEIDQAGVDRVPLPPALTPEIGLKFRTFEARIEAKYGVRNYLREMARSFDEIDESIAALIPDIMGDRDPLGAAMAVVRMYNEAHVYDVQVRREKKQGRQKIYFRNLEPRTCATRVIQPNLKNFEIVQDYEEGLLLLAQREILLGKKAAEAFWNLQPVAITYHALLRLWHRGGGDGKTFHALIASAFKRLRGATALIEICHLASKRPLPSHAAVPFLDGFIVASLRITMAESSQTKWGFRREKDSAAVMNSQDEKHFSFEGYLEAQGEQMTIRDSWFAVTFMNANDIGAWERVVAARHFDELIEGLNLDEIARYLEWVGRSLNKPFPQGYDLQIPDPEKVIKLQAEMLPRTDVRDERWHLLRF